jgi:hypothetical protein
MTWLTPEQRQAAYDRAVEECGDDPVFLFPNPLVREAARRARAQKSASLEGRTLKARRKRHSARNHPAANAPSKAAE